MKYTCYEGPLMQDVVEIDEYYMIECVGRNMKKPKTETIEELFMYPPKEEYDIFTVLPFQEPLTLIYCNSEYILDVLEVEQGETLELYTTYPDDPFYECQVQLIIVKNEEGTILKKYYLEQEFNEPNPTIEGEIERIHSQVKEIGIDPTAEHVKIVVTNY